jgi:undecaprenyl-diphosphatase
MTAIVLPGQVYRWEVDVVKWAQDIGYPRWAFTLTANRLTNADTPEGAVMITSLIAGFWLVRARIESFLIALTVPLHVAANLPKLFVDRERPSGLIDGIDGEGGMKSFPSGHAEFAVLFYGFLVYLALLRVTHPLARGALVGAWVVLLALVGFARMEVGKHWPLDIAAGYVIGVGLLSMVVWLHTSLKRAEEGD